ncbi:MAG: TIR domain-containing protein, partial [Myxococcales bacterium]
ERARHFARALEKAGHEVWWDLHVRGGAQFSKAIEEALKAADTVVVLWSKNAVESPWVRDEAAAGRDSGRLVPVTIDGTEPPLGFRQFQTLDLSGWKGRGTPAPLKILLGDIAAMAGNAGGNDAGRDPVGAAPAPRVSSAGWVAGNRGLLVGFTAALLLMFGAAAFRLWSNQRPNSTDVAVIAGDQQALSQQMARKLLVKLSVLQGNAAMNLNLIDDRSAAKTADFRISVTGTENAGQLDGAVALVSGSGNTVLWSKEITQPSGSNADVDEALAFAAARALSCAIEEASGQYGRLPARMRRIYLNACAALGEAGYDNQTLLPQLKQVTDQAPGFRPAWAKLITAQADYVSSLDLNPIDAEDHAAREELRRLINSGRKVDPQMAEASLAEVILDPDLSFDRAIALVDRAKQHDPHNPLVLRAHASVLQNVGRMYEATEDLQQAAQLDPLSPYTRADLITTLLYAGMIEKARAELNQAKRLWPGAPAINEASFAFEVHEGDTEKVMQERGIELTGSRLYVAALRDPTDEKVGAFLNYMKSDLTGRGLGRFGWALQLLGHVNRPAEAFALIDRFRPDQVEALRRNSYILFRPWMASLRADPRFMQLSGRLKLTNYWIRTNNWPDFCSNQIHAYDCKTEAAKLE